MSEQKRQKRTNPKCPSCKKPFSETKTPPFCTERCKMIDLGKWLGGEYFIPGERAHLIDESETHD